MPIDQILAKHATAAAGVLLIVAFTMVRVLSKSSTLKRDFRTAQLYLGAFVLLSFAAKFVPLEWTLVQKLTYIASLILFSFGAIRGVAGIVFHYRRLRKGIETPKILHDLLDAGLYLLALFIILQATLNINFSALLASSAVLSLVIGLALQDTLGNLFAGLWLQAERPFGERDWVRIGAHSGQLLESGWRATRMVTSVGEVLTLPNSLVAREAIYNLSQRGTSLRKVLVPVGYEAPPNLVKDVMLELLRAHPRVLLEPSATVRVVESGPTSLVYELLFSTRFQDGLQTEDEVRSQLWYRLRRAKVTLPPVNTHVHMATPARFESAQSDIDVRELLHRVDFLSVVSDELCDDLAARAAVVRYGRDEIIIHQGDTDTQSFYVIAEGEVAVRVRSRDQGDSEVARLSTHGFFGEMAVLTGEPRTASVVALCDTTLVRIARADFADLFARDPKLAETLIEVLAQRRQGLAQATAATPVSESTHPAETRQLFEKLRKVFRQLT